MLSSPCQLLHNFQRILSFGSFSLHSNSSDSLSLISSSLPTNPPTHSPPSQIFPYSTPRYFFSLVSFTRAPVQSRFHPFLRSRFLFSFFQFCKVFVTEECILFNTNLLFDTQRSLSPIFSFFFSLCLYFFSLFYNMVLTSWPGHVGGREKEP